MGRKIYRTVKILELKSVLPADYETTPTSVIDLMNERGINAHYIKFINSLLVR